MDEYFQEQHDAYLAIKAYEWKADKLLPPKKLPRLSWLSDRSYLLSKLRLYLRKLSYEIFANEKHVGLKDEDFQSMKTMLVYREQEVKETPRLEAYTRVVNVFERRPTSVRTVEAVLAYLLSHREFIEVEDYVDLASFLGSFSALMHNTGQKKFARLEFKCQVQVIDGVYGSSWKKGDRYLPHRTFTNLVFSALDLAQEFDWNLAPMDLVPTTDKKRSVYDWIELVLLYYSSRLERSVRKPTLHYLRGRVAYYAGNYPEAATELIKLGRQPLEFYGLSIRRMNLLVYYELQFNTGPEQKKLARKLEPDPTAALNRMRAKLKDLVARQDRNSYRVTHFSKFIEGYADLLRIRREADVFLENSVQRLEYLRENVPPAVDALRGYNHFSGVWLRKQLMALR